MKMPEYLYTHIYINTAILLSQIPSKQDTQAYITHNMQEAVLATKNNSKSLKSIFKKKSEESFYIKL